MIIQVTEWHIEMGERDDRFGCPIARALWEQTGDRWYVDGDRCGVEDEESDVELALPESVWEFVRNFDAGEWHVGPFQFELETRGAV